MAWLESIGDLLASREWWLLMMIVIVAGAFMFPDNRLGQAESESERDSRDDSEKRD